MVITAWEVRKRMAEKAMELLGQAAATAAPVSGEEIDIAAWATAITGGVSDHRHAARSLAGIARALAENGMHDDAMSLFQAALADARLAGREAVLEIIATAAATIASIDDGETLWNVYEAIVTTDTWLLGPA